MANDGDMNRHLASNEQCDLQIQIALPWPRYQLQDPMEFTNAYPARGEAGETLQSMETALVSMGKVDCIADRLMEDRHRRKSHFPLSGRHRYDAGPC